MFGNERPAPRNFKTKFVFALQNLLEEILYLLTWSTWDLVMLSIMEFPTILLLPPGAPRGAVPEDHIAADAILGKNILLNPSLHHVEHRL